jgi:hypothetical protein
MKSKLLTKISLGLALLFIISCTKEVGKEEFIESPIISEAEAGSTQPTAAEIIPLIEAHLVWEFAAPPYSNYSDPASQPFPDDVYLIPGVPVAEVGSTLTFKIGRQYTKILMPIIYINNYVSDCDPSYQPPAGMSVDDFLTNEVNFILAKPASLVCKMDGKNLLTGGYKSYYFLSSLIRTNLHPDWGYNSYGNPCGLDGEPFGAWVKAGGYYLLIDVPENDSVIEVGGGYNIRRKGSQVGVFHGTVICNIDVE